jgi:hypothetical protein
MRAIWNVVQRWAKYGDVYAPADPASKLQARTSTATHAERRSALG